MSTSRTGEKPYGSSLINVSLCFPGAQVEVVGVSHSPCILPSRREPGREEYWGTSEADGNPRTWKKKTKTKASKGRSQLAIVSGCSFPCGLQIEQTKKHARVPTASLVIPFINSRDGPKGQIPSYQHLAASLRKWVTWGHIHSDHSLSN